MKKRILLCTIVAGFAYLTLSSHSGGLAFVGGLDRSGAQGTTTSCGTVGAGCHGGTGSATTVTITVDSASTSVPVTHYVPGFTYTIKIHGTNSSSNPKFGFQFTSVKGTGVSQTQAGTCSGFPAQVAITPLSGLSIVEQTAAITATTAGVYDESFTWIAPSTGAGNITLYCTLNAVNGNALADGGDICNNTSVVLAQEADLSVASGISNATEIKAFPNPATDNLNLQFANAVAGNYAVLVYDLNGKCIASSSVEVSATSQTANVNTAGWMPGFYQLVVAKDGNNRVIPVVKQ